MTVVPQLLSAQNRTETRWIQSTNALGKKVILSRNESLNRRKTQLSSCQPVIFYHISFHFCQKTQTKIFDKFTTAGNVPPVFLLNPFGGESTQPFRGNSTLWGERNHRALRLSAKSPGRAYQCSGLQIGTNMKLSGFGTVLNEPALRVLAFENVYIKWKTILYCNFVCRVR